MKEELEEMKIPSEHNLASKNLNLTKNIDNQTIFHNNVEQPEFRSFPRILIFILLNNFIYAYSFLKFREE